MKVAICDSDKFSAGQLEDIAYQCYGKFHCECDVFYTSKELYNYIQNGERYNIYFIEISMEEMDGMELAKFIRSCHEYAMIIFVAKDADYMESAFDICAFNYIVKPFNSERVYKVLLNAQIYLEKIHKTFYYKIQNSVNAISSNAIYYFEKSERKIYLYTQDSVIPFYATLKHILRELDKTRFVQINISDIVNVVYIKQYLTDKVILMNNIELPITRHYAEDLKRVMHNYLSYIRL